MSALSILTNRISLTCTMESGFLEELTGITIVFLLFNFSKVIKMTILCKLFLLVSLKFRFYFFFPMEETHFVFFLAPIGESVQKKSKKAMAYLRKGDI